MKMTKKGEISTSKTLQQIEAMLPDDMKEPAKKVVNACKDVREYRINVTIRITEHPHNVISFLQKKAIRILVIEHIIQQNVLMKPIRRYFFFLD